MFASSLGSVAFTGPGSRKHLHCKRHHHYPLCQPKHNRNCGHCHRAPGVRELRRLTGNAGGSEVQRWQSHPTTCRLSGRAMARTGLRIDADVSIVPPKIPYGGFSPVRLQGWLIERCLPSWRRPLVPPVWFASLLRAPRFQTCSSPFCVGAVVRWSAAIRAVWLLYPGGPRSGPGFAVLVHPHLVGPIRPTPRHISTSPPGGLYEMPLLCPFA